MIEHIILKNNPKIEFQLLEHGFQLIDEQTTRNSGYYTYHDLNFVELQKTYFPRLAKWMRIFTWILNGVPFFPDAESSKKAKVTFHFRQSKLGMWLTDTNMTNNVKILKRILDNKKRIQ